MQEASSFVGSYSQAERPRIAFAWNGKHASEFRDANQDFRWAVVTHCLASPGEATPNLLADLFLADAEWSAEAWAAPHHFAQLGALLLERGTSEALDPFSVGFVRSFDTFGACHAMSLSPQLLAQLSESANAAIATATEEPTLNRLVSARDLLAKLSAGTASQGWATVSSGTSVSDLQVIWPRWQHRLWQAVKRLLGRNAT